MKETHTQMEQLKQQAECLYTQTEVSAAITEVAQRVTQELQGSCPVILTVMNGGMIFAAELISHLAFPLQCEYVHATRYGDATSGGALEWKVAPPDAIEGRTVLVVDDILDEGHTLEAIMQRCRTMGATAVYSAVLVDKQHQRKARPDLRADFTGLRVDDYFIFGYGMDVKGYWRNAPGIFVFTS